MAEKLEDLNLPNAVVGRLIKDALADNVLVGKEARVALARAASVFVLYVTSAASNVAKKAKRKTVTAQDVLDAMNDLEFESFIEPLQKYHESFKDTKKKKKDAAKNKEAADAEAIPEADEEIAEDVEMDEEVEEEQ